MTTVVASDSTFTTVSASDRAPAAAYYNLIRSTSGLMAYWPMLETSGTTVAEATGTYPGTAGASTTRGSTVLLSGEPGGVTGTNVASGSQIDIGGTFANLGFAGTLPFSAEIWVENLGTSTTRYIFGFLNSLTAGTSGGWRLIVSGAGALTFSRYDTTATATAVVTGAILPFATAGVHHIAAVYTGTAASIYFDGTLAAGPTANTRVMPALTVAPKIGRLNYSTGGAVVGRYGHAAIYNRALTADEIAAHYTAGRNAGLDLTITPSDRSNMTVTASDAHA